MNRISLILSCLLLVCNMAWCQVSKGDEPSGPKEEKQVAEILNVYFKLDAHIESTGYSAADQYVAKLLFGDESDDLAKSFSDFKKLWNVQTVKDYESLGQGKWVPAIVLSIRKESKPDDRFTCYRVKGNLYGMDPRFVDFLKQPSVDKRIRQQYLCFSEGIDHFFIFDHLNNRMVGMNQIFVPEIAVRLKQIFGNDIGFYAEDRCLQIISPKREGRFLFNEESEPNFTDYFKQLVGWNELGTIETPAFLHGQQGLNDYFKRVVRLASDAEEADTVMLSVVVQKNGIVSEPKIVKKTGSAPETQLLAACMDMPKWQPAYEEGVPVKKEAFFALRLKRMSQSLAAKQDVTPIEAIPHAGAAGGDGVKVFDVVEQMPEFPGGPAALMKWIGDNIKYPAIAEENGIQGRVVCTFIVERDGSVTDVQIARSIDPSLDKEAVRVLKKMPKWNPGKLNGKAVRVKYTVPVTFRLDMPAPTKKIATPIR